MPESVPHKFNGIIFYIFPIVTPLTVLTHFYYHTHTHKHHTGIGHKDEQKNAITTRDEESNIKWWWLSLSLHDWLILWMLLAPLFLMMKIWLAFIIFDCIYLVWHDMKSTWKLFFCQITPCSTFYYVRDSFIMLSCHVMPYRLNTNNIYFCTNFVAPIVPFLLICVVICIFVCTLKQLLRRYQTNKVT